LQFTTFSFLALLAATTVIYYLFPLKFRWYVLLVFSMVFYGFFGLYNALCLSATILTTYITSYITDYLHNKRDTVIKSLGESALREEKAKVKNRYRNLQRVYLTLCLLINLGFLAMVKLDGSLIMPVGLSFYTFRAAGYLIDVYRGSIKAEKNLPRLVLFCAFFPQILIGPISRYDDLAPSLLTGNKFEVSNLSEGSLRILFGFFKKLVIADRLLPVVRELIADSGHGESVVIALLLYSVALYCDFTGGIDIALGAGRVVGVRLPENFNKPFMSVSIANYWQRWHITMGSWFRDYLFYPLSTSKVIRSVSRWMQSHINTSFGKRVPIYFITMVVWFTTGAWHGTSINYIGWGLANGVVIMISLMFETLYRRFHDRYPGIGKTRWYHALTIVRTYLLMRVISAFFLFESTGATLRALLSVFTKFSLSGFKSLPELMPVEDMFIAGVGVILLIVIGTKKKETFSKFKPVLRYTAFALLLLTVLLFGVYGYGYDTELFIYNRF